VGVFLGGRCGCSRARLFI